MRKLANIWLGSLMVVAMAVAQEPDPREADHEALRALLVEVTTAINEQDLEKLGNTFAKAFSFTTSDQTVITSREEIKAYYDKMFKGEQAPLKALKVTPKASELTRFIDANTGVCRGTAEEEFTLGSGEAYTFESAWTATMVKEDGAWKVSAAHVGIHFFDNPVVKKIADSRTTTAVMAGIFGLVVGAAGILLATTGRKKS